MAPWVIAAQANEDFVPSITIEPVENHGISITGLCVNNTPYAQELSYFLSVKKSNPLGNTMNNEKSGKFFIEPGENIILSKTTMNLDPVDHAEIVLKVFNAENEQIAQHTRILANGDELNE